MSVFIYPFHERSKSAFDISRAAGFKRIRREGSTFVGEKKHTIINWGCSDLSPETEKCGRIVNSTRAVRTSANKLSFFKKTQKIARVPPFTADLKEAMGWVKQGILVVARTSLNGRGGSDIVFLDDPSKFVECQLYTQYIKKRAEYRVHFAFGKVLDVQKKILRKTDDAGNSIDTSTVDFRIRNHSNGFIFVRDGISPPSDVLDQAKLAFAASDLDFGAVDVIFNEHSGQAYVLEINTAPGLEGTTLENYISAFQANL